MKLVIMGTIGSGKGTQAKAISKKFGIAHISTGDVMRSHIKNQTPLGIKLQDIMAKGDLVDDETTAELLKDRMSQEDAKNGFILDGYPRSLAQADTLKNITSLDKAIYLNVDNDTVIERLSGRLTCTNCGNMFHIKNNPPKRPDLCDGCNNILIQREDDREEAIQKRLEIFTTQTLPVIDIYRNQGILLEVAPGGIAEVRSTIFKELEGLKQA
ncbi:MAG: adenylate kinase [Defluviitaleaceae bacterium]|nr:adenylate kinase [Defluviitaleaceae bacterium]